MDQEKGILQPHTLTNEFDNVVGDDKSKQLLKDGPFDKAFKYAQVALYAWLFFILIFVCSVFWRSIISGVW